MSSKVSSLPMTLINGIFNKLENIILKQVTFDLNLSNSLLLSTTRTYTSTL